MSTTTLTFSDDPFIGPTTGADVSSAAALVRRLAADPQVWRDRVRFGRGEERWYARLDVDPDHEVWLISWLPGQRTGLHDHGEALGAFAVVRGTLTETTVRSGPLGLGDAVRSSRREFAQGGIRGFGYEHVHEVANLSTDPAVSIHAYAPELTAMTQYVLEHGRLRVVSSEQAGVDW
ncbi:cysteine dioxygenase [Actinopolymorpha alba]|uniref:cysteine dioxygenase n=1 Tax=Actinopolymorpha alba TaxID=533267 RepID=UPI00036CBF0A|nr:cysteine dioxygenase family protein [Actinopolymorpha alba]